MTRCPNTLAWSGCEGTLCLASPGVKCVVDESNESCTFATAVSQDWRVQSAQIQYNQFQRLHELVPPWYSSCRYHWILGTLNVVTSSMAPTTLWGKMVAHIFMCHDAKSICWPGRTRSMAIAFLASGALLAIAQLGLGASMAHQLLSTGTEVNCRMMNDTGDFDVSASESMFKTQVKSLPLIFANLDRVVYANGYRVETADGSFGPVLLRVDRPSQWGGKFMTVLCLVINPLLLTLSHLWFIRCHSIFTCFPISNRKAMAWAYIFLSMFLVNTTNTNGLDTFPKNSIRKEDHVCWHSDRAMQGLEKWRTWARGIVVSNVVLGILGGCLMLGYFAVAIKAASMNHQNDQPQPQPQPVALDTLNDRFTNPSSANTDAISDNHRNFPSPRLGPRNSATLANGLSAKKRSALEQQKPTTAEDQERAEQEAHVNPFLNPKKVVS